MASLDNPVLLAAKVTKRFGGVHALNGVTFKIQAGEIVGLVGPNGAGKSVLQSCIAGAIKPDSGEIFISGTKTNGWPPERLCHIGVSRTFQIPQPFLRMSVGRTVMVGALFGSGERTTMAAARQVAEDALDTVGFAGHWETPIAELNSVEIKRVDLARALACQPKLLLLDEVAAGLMSGEIADIVRIVREVGKRNIAVLMVEHIVHSITAACSRVIVLQQGRIVADDTPEAVVKIPQVIEAYFGSESVHA